MLYCDHRGGKPPNPLKRRKTDRKRSDKKRPDPEMLVLAAGVAAACLILLL